MTEDQRSRFIPGYNQLALTKEGAKTANDELIPMLESVNDSVNRLLEISDQTAKSLSPEDRAEAETITQLLVGQLRLPIVGPGAVSEKELELLNRIIANPTAFFSYDKSNKKRLQVLKDRIQKQTNAKLKQLGIKIPKEETEKKLGFEAK